MKMRYAQIIVDISHEKLDRTFTYRIPDVLKQEIVLGSVVRIPFGKSGRVIKGYVVGFTEKTDIAPDRIKDIQEVVTGDDTSDAHLVALAAWMSRNYGSTTIQALKTVIPVRKKISAKLDKKVHLTDRKKAEEYLELCEQKHYAARERVLRVLLDETPDDDGQERSMTQAELLEKSQAPLSVVNALSEAGVLTVDVSETFRKVTGEAEKLPPAVLSDEQKEVVRLIFREWEEKDRPVLINGVTGSGKTVVYMELIDRILKEGKEAIVLIPEISLTRQTVLRFLSRFGNRVSFMHSRLSEGERYDQMKAAKSGRVSIMVGPRSALFTPFSHLGLIVIDEEHEQTYHSEQMPRYESKEVAIERAKLEHAHVVFGSATPSLESAYHVRTGDYFGVNLPNRVGGKALPKAEIVDMRKELSEGNRSVFSRRLKELIEDRLRKKEQILLFLNRRGYAGCVTCRSCGTVIKCPHCDVSLTRHRNGRLVCHYCGYSIPEYHECPKCHSKMIGGMTIGTEQVEDLLQKEFPGARVLRMDADTTRGKEGHGRILKEFADHEADILLGTQMIVKGHDFPLVTLVGVLMADLSLNESDFRSSEYTYDLIAQAIGRAGRGNIPGVAVIQTYRPDHYAIQAAARQDYEMFYQEEISYRRILNYPPVGTMMAILGSARDEDLLMKGMDYLKKYIDYIDPEKKLGAIGPAPQSVGKIRDHYRGVIYLRSGDRNQLIRAKDLIENYIGINPGFTKIDIQFDFTV